MGNICFRRRRVQSCKSFFGQNSNYRTSRVYLLITVIYVTKLCAQQWFGYAWELRHRSMCVKWKEPLWRRVSLVSVINFFKCHGRPRIHELLKSALNEKASYRYMVRFFDFPSETVISDNCLAEWDILIRAWKLSDAHYYLTIAK